MVCNAMNKSIASITVGLGALVSMTFVGSVFAATKVVGPGGDYTTIQAAVNDLPVPGPHAILVGPHAILVRAGTYNETVQIYNKNTGASDDSQRIIIMADPAAAVGSVIVKPPAGSPGVRVEQSKFITLRGLVITGVKGNSVPAIRLIGGSPGNEDIAIIACQIHDNAGHGIQIEGNNPRTWIMNNLIRDNGVNEKSGHGVTIAAGTGAGATLYMVNNTIFKNKLDGVFVQSPCSVYLVNNLIVANGKYGFRRANGSTDPTLVTLLHNMFYANKLRDIANVSQTLDATDSGNRTTKGNESIGVIGCAFPNCSKTTALAALFVNPTTAAPDLHLSAASPAIDRGVNTFTTDGTNTWQIMDDLEGTQLPLDGDGDCFAIVDAGCYEAPAVPCSLDTVEPLNQLLLGNGGGLTNVNADTLGHIPAAGYAQTSGTYAGMNVGTATFAVTAGNALNLGGIPSSGYVQTGDARVVHAITNLYWTGSSGTVTVGGNTGTINFGSGGGGIGGTNLWLLNGGTALTNDELEIVTAGGLTGVLSNYSGRVQLTLSNTASAGTVTYAESSGYATNAG